MMKLAIRQILLLALFVGLPACLSAQRAVGAAESKQMIDEVCATASKMNSLRCDFKQVKNLSLLKTEMVSQGKMYYKGGKFLRWEYISPYTYTFILNRDSVILKSSTKTDVISVRSSKLFQQIARIMMNSVTGKSLSNTEDFSVAMYLVDGAWMARLTPRQKALSQFFSCIQLYIDPKIKMVNRVELIEKSGDTTRITLTRIEKNVAIGDAVFSTK